MKKLGKKNYKLISEAVKSTGSYNPNEILFYFEEQLLCSQVKEIYNFLTWVHQNNKCFGSGNYEQIFSEFKVAVKC